MADKVQYTPGPWTMKDYAPQGYIILGADGELVETVYTGYANAQLITAAPEMLEALKSLFEHCAMVHKHWGENSNQKEADAAIAAARAVIAKTTAQP